ncbi:hypothetical protein L0337_39790 [candidate division KSB1 bacterium]|nr:hypothetical protein [candidate division KSB1 bacterium]
MADHFNSLNYRIRKDAQVSWQCQAWRPNEFGIDIGSLIRYILFAKDLSKQFIFGELK